jgi:hypothetical protein
VINVRWMVCHGRSFAPVAAPTTRPGVALAPASDDVRQRGQSRVDPLIGLGHDVCRPAAGITKSNAALHFWQISVILLVQTRVNLSHQSVPCRRF